MKIKFCCIAIISVGFFFVGGMVPNIAHSGECDETVLETVDGIDYFEDFSDRDLSRQRAINKALAKAIKPHVPPNWTSTFSAKLSSAKSDRTSSGAQESLQLEIYESARGKTKSFRIIDENISNEAGFLKSTVTAKVEVCIPDKSQQKFEITFGDLIFLNGKPSSKLRTFMVRTFPQVEKGEIFPEKNRRGDVSVSGEVAELATVPFIMKKSGQSFSVFGSSAPKKEFVYRTVPRDMDEYNQVSSKIRMQARFVALHKVVQSSFSLSRDVIVTGVDDWQGLRQREAMLLIEKSIAFTAKRLGGKLEKTLETTPLY
jgi:hypothetical protein